MNTIFLRNSLQAVRRMMTMALLIGLSASCSDSSSNADSTLMGEWYKRSSYEGVARSGAVGFVIDGKAYVGTGYTGTVWLKDFYEYDADKNNWFKRAEFPGIARSAAVAFTANGKGYVGTGYDGTNYLKDFYEYDPIADTWTQIADFMGTARFQATAFSVENVGYVGTGYDGNYLKDFYAYDPSTNTWTQKASYSGDKLINAFAFTIDGRGYVGGGMNNGLLNQEFWEYDPINNLWIEKNDLQDDDNDDDENDDDYTIARSLAATFVINGKGYVALGARGSLDAGVWEYTPALDQWTQMTTFEGSSRETPVGFSIGDKGYITTGRNSTARYDDLWMFDPTAEDVD
ncbi:kelch repeat-containing protein [Chryseolinea sp. T2]|uniref:Kelch repeat-containing protein n=1 Tax=Chryseolinea sp. T2 TaxID=3129255 RepID=UPI00307748A1